MPQRSIHEKCFALSDRVRVCLRPSHSSGEITGSEAFSCAILSCLCPDPVFLPAAGDELADLVAHLDLLGPRPRTFVPALRGRVDAELAAEELMRGGVVEMVERALADQDVTAGVDVGADVE